MNNFYERFDHCILPEPNSGCWLWTKSALPRARASAYSGYGYFRIRGTFHYAHRVAYEAIHGDGSAAGLDVRHGCDNPICVNPDHLSIGTRAENLQDMVRRGRSLRGEKNLHAKLTEAAATDVIRLAVAGIEQGRIATHFGIDQSAVSYLKNGKRWPHLTKTRIAMPRPKKPGMLIDDAEIVARVGQERAIEILNALDSSRETARYEPYWGGRRYRFAVEAKLSEAGFRRAPTEKTADVSKLRVAHRNSKAVG